MDAQAAVDAPRLHFEDGLVYAEPGIDGARAGGGRAHGWPGSAIATCSSAAARRSSATTARARSAAEGIRAGEGRLSRFSRHAGNSTLSRCARHRFARRRARPAAAGTQRAHTCHQHARACRAPAATTRAFAGYAPAFPAWLLTFTTCDMNAGCDEPGAGPGGRRRPCAGGDTTASRTRAARRQRLGGVQRVVLRRVGRWGAARAPRGAPAAGQSAWHQRCHLDLLILDLMPLPRLLLSYRPGRTRVTGGRAGRTSVVRARHRARLERPGRDAGRPR